MSKTTARDLMPLSYKLKAALLGPAGLAFLPAFSLSAFWLGGELGLVFAALAAPAGIALLGGFSSTQPLDLIPRDSVTGLLLRDGFDALAKHVFENTLDTGRHSTCFMVELDDYKSLIERHGQDAADRVMQCVGQRLVEIVRDADNVARYGDSRFAVCLSPVRHFDLELSIQMAGRFQMTIEEPISIDGTTVYMSGSVGFCLRSRAPRGTEQDWLAAANAALLEAQKRGPSAIRAFSSEMQRKEKSRHELRDEVANALESGQIQPWYQPQISTDTGKVTGFEALARWSHPVRGMIPPTEFLPLLEEADLLERLAEVMMYHAFTALKAWDSAGSNVPQVGVNFAGPELGNPRLVEKVKWELDRFDLTPDRLAVEVLETVVSEAPDDVIAMNIRGLGEMGCRVDLDDFGTGHASISAIRRFAISRIKIDRSFVMKADRDPDQQRMIGAILSMAERMDLETLAEGVETVGEHALLAQLGCDHVQGFGIARPMPFDQTLDWIAAHDAKLQDAPEIKRKSSS